MDSTISVQPGEAPDSLHRARRAAWGSFAGAVVDWYDFLLYGITAALVFNREFFPQIGPAMGTLAAFATFGVGFLFRPLGGIIFGHFGDRLGRKRMLMMTVWMMGIATACIGLLPSFNQIGWWAPVLLVFLRREPENAALLKAVATATKFFARRWPEAFYDVLRSIAQVAAGSSMNGEEFVRELMGLFGSFATVCCAEFNADEETVRGVIAVCVRLAVQAGNRGKVAVFAFLNKLLRLENDNEGIRAVFAQMAPQLLDVNLTDSRHP